MTRRILYAGRFDIQSVDERCRQGLNPTHHLHAVPELRRRGVVVDVFGSATQPEGGALAFQRRLCKASQGYDAIVAHSLVEVNMLAGLRAIGLFRVPIVAFVHSVNPRSVQRISAHGADRLLVLNAHAMQVLRHSGVSPTRLRRFDFGADLSFYQPRPAPEAFILSVGVSQRDHATLVDAALRSQLPLVIVGKLAHDLQARVDREGQGRITVLSQGNYDLSFERLLDLYNRARLVVVNHHGTDHPFGLNAVVEAMAMAKPVVITRGRGIDIDPAQEGFGSVVPAHDPAALAASLTGLFQRDATALAAMGERARDLALSHYNSTRMADDLIDALGACRP